MLGSRIDGTMLIAGGAVDRRLEPKGGYLAKRREGQRMQFAAVFRLCHDQAPMLGPDPVPEGVLTASMQRAESTFCLQSWQVARHADGETATAQRDKVPHDPGPPDTKASRAYRLLGRSSSASHIQCRPDR